MKFAHVNVDNLRHLIPAWSINPVSLARAIDGLLSDEKAAHFRRNGGKVYDNLPFWVEVDANTEPVIVRIMVPDNDIDLCGNLIVNTDPIICNKAQIIVPLNPVFKDYEDISSGYVVYLHSFQTETHLGYIGVSKHAWFERLSQHISSARNGSHYLFHGGIINHQSVEILHRVFFCGLDIENAMKLEEDLVAMFTLYPLGLNMIPGGYAGIRYLSKLCKTNINTPSERDTEIERISNISSLLGKPNPLCAARWASDQDFVNRVICGHSGRLTPEQIRTIRLHTSFGTRIEEIAAVINVSNINRVKKVINNKTYGRVH
jgi:hypothetical protein